MTPSFNRAVMLASVCLGLQTSLFAREWWEQNGEAAEPPAKQAAEMAVEEGQGPAAAVPAKELPAPAAGPVVIVRFAGPIMTGATRVFVERCFDIAREKHAAAVIIDMDTPGGRLDITEQIVALMRQLEIPIYVYVNLHAQSAGAIISLGSDAIYMAPGGRIGSATPILMDPLGKVQHLPDDVREKLLSDTRALVRGLAQENGYIPELAMAMVDPEVEVRIGQREVSRRGDLVSLNAQEAVEIIPPRDTPLLATAVANDLDHLHQLLRLQDARRIKLRPLGFTRIFQAAALLFVLGVALLAVEIFVIPGFGIAGFAGIFGVVGALLLPFLISSGTPVGSFEALKVGDVVQGLVVYLVVAVVAAIIGTWLLMRMLTTSRIFGQLILHGATTAEAGYVGTNVDEGNRLLGRHGVTVTSLRPSGIARIDGKRVDVVSSGDFIDEGEPIRVKKIDGPRVVVVRAPATAAESGPPA